MAVTGRQHVVLTYRYLRLSMVLLTLVLAVSVVIESVRSRAVLDSISAYYYTPAQGVFVGALVAIGIGLIALRGRTEVEDVALNLAGMFAPAVAFVPTPQGRPADFSTAGIDNNMPALLVGGGVAVVLAGVLAATDAVDQVRASLLVRPGEYAAAVAMFFSIGVVVWVNRHRRRFGRAYSVVVGLMLATQLVWVTALVWAHAALVVEVLMIALFAVFWSLQTWELRYEALDSSAV